MKKRQFFSLCIAMAVAAPVNMANAAKPSAILKQIEGRVLVVQSRSTALGHKDMPLFNSNRVITLEGGSAQIVYPDGCILKLTDNSLLNVAGPCQCSTDRSLPSSTAEFQSQHIGQSRNLSIAAMIYLQQATHSSLVFGGFVTAGAIGAIIDSNQPSNININPKLLLLLRQQPVSP